MWQEKVKTILKKKKGSIPKTMCFLQNYEEDEGQTENICVLWYYSKKQKTYHFLDPRPCPLGKSRCLHKETLVVWKKTWLHMFSRKKEIPQHEFLAKNAWTFRGGGGTFEEVREESFTQWMLLRIFTHDSPHSWMQVKLNHLWSDLSGIGFNLQHSG